MWEMWEHWAPCSVTTHPAVGDKEWRVTMSTGGVTSPGFHTFQDQPGYVSFLGTSALEVGRNPSPRLSENKKFKILVSGRLLPRVTGDCAG